jgi:CRP/FNR family transcriptional regulator, anaerobic regulatory protein
LFLLASGWACRERVLSNGRRAILDVYLPGDFIGLEHLFLGRAPASVVTLTSVGYHTVERDALQALSRQSPEVALEIACGLVEEEQRLERHTTRLSRLPAIERTAAGLRDLYERWAAGRGKVEKSDRVAFRLPMTQQQLADHLGLNLVYLNRVLKALGAGNMLKVRNGTVIIEDASRLRSAAGDASDLA